MRLPAAVALLLLSPALARAATITVTTTEDELADTGTCSLREAIIAANGNQTSGALAGECIAGSSSQADTIVLSAGTFHLTRSGDEWPTLMSPAIGDLDVYGSVDIQGQGPALTVISAAGLGARVMHFDAFLGFFSLSGVSLRDGDSTDGAGGGLYLANGYALSLSSVEISGNHAALNGGGVAIDYGELSLDHVVISDNSSGENGGGFYHQAWGRNVVLTDSSFTGNRAEGGGASGGGAYVQGGLVTLSRCTISDNHATFRGGGLMAEVSNTLSIAGATVSGNEAETGGGIYLFLPPGVVSIESSTVSGNRASLEGGGIASFPGGELKLTNVTLADNSAGSGASALVASRGVTLADTIVAGSCSQFFVAATSLGGNLESPGDSCGLDHATDQVAVGADQLALGPLVDNGGGTLTHRPAPESVAVDHGLAANCPAADQRGIARPYGAGCDVGAVELGEEPCGFSGENACLLGERFRVHVGYATASESGVGRVMRFAGVRAESDQSAFFTFFDNANFEMGVKMVDACALNDSFWVFVSGLTNQEFTVRIDDSLTGESRTYTNPLGTYPLTIGATDGVAGFDCTPGTPASARTATAAEVHRAALEATTETALETTTEAIFPIDRSTTGDCLPGAATACHLDGRFQVEVDWATAATTGAAQVMSFETSRATSDQSSFWWFFDPANFEVGVKLVDACTPPFNATWVFVSGLTNQGFTVRVTDTTSGLSRTYVSPIGSYPQTVGATTAVDGFPCGQ